MMMKRIGWALGMAFFMAAMAVAEPLRVGVTTGVHHEPLVETLQREAGLEVVLVERLNAAALAQLDVLLITQTESPARLTRAGVALRRWIESGGGVMLLHDAVGYRAHMPLFREVGMGTHHELDNRLRPAMEHPVLAGVDPETDFTPNFAFDHIAMDVGPNGTVLLKNPKGGAGLLAGTLGEGRVLLNGMLSGRHRPVDGASFPAEPEGPERVILINGIRWLSGR